MKAMIKYDQPFHFKRGLQLRNGYCLAPLETRTALFNGEVSRSDCYFHQQHAVDVGLDIIGSAYVATSGCTVTGSISVASDSMITGLKTLATTIHQQGAKAVLQLVHAGRETNPVATNGQPVLGPSAVRATHGTVVVPVALTTAQIGVVIDQFGAATQRAILAGFDGVEIHGANGFLLQQFMSPLANRRSDQFGGSLINRLRFPLMVVQRVLQVAQQASRPFVVGYRLSPEEVETGGLSLTDNLALLQGLKLLNVDYLSLSLHHYDQQSVTMDTTQSVVSIVHQQVSDVPLMVAGQIRTTQDVVQLQATSDLIAGGRELIVEPHWPQRYRRPASLRTKKQVTAVQIGLPQSIFQYL